MEHLVTLLRTHSCIHFIYQDIKLLNIVKLWMIQFIFHYLKIAGSAGKLCECGTHGYLIKWLLKTIKNSAIFELYHFQGIII